MEEIDTDLARKGMPIPGRQIAAVLEAAFDQGIVDGSLTPPMREPRAGVYHGPDLSIRIERWYDEVYGDRLKVDLGPGSTAVVLQGEVWEYRFPNGGGPAIFFARDLESGPALVHEGTAQAWLSTDDPRRRTWKAQKFDVLAGVVGLPESIVPRLGANDLREVVGLFATEWHSLTWLNRARNHALVRSAMADFHASVRHLTARPAELGQSRWASQQGLEKMLKSCLEHSVGKYPKGGKDAHNLFRLAELVGEATGFRLPDVALREVDCKPGIRYGEEPTGSLSDVVRRSRIALAVSGVLAAFLCQHLPLMDTPNFVAGDRMGEAASAVARLLERSGMAP
jgi:hypothetical protein